MAKYPTDGCTAEFRYSVSACNWHRNENLDLARALKRCGMTRECGEAVERAREWNHLAMVGGVRWEPA